MASLTRRGLGGLALGCAALAPLAARAQPAWPARTVSIIVPYSAGGATDILARKVAEGLSNALGKTVVVDNRPGAGGTLGTALAANAKPDGYTLFLGQVSSHGIAPNLYTELRYDPVKSFVPIVSVETIPNIVVVNKALPVNSIDELIAYAKAHPDTLNFASSGTGASTHLSGEMFKSMAGVTMTHVPFHGSAQAIVSVMGGQTQMIFDNMPSAYPYVTAGNLKALAVTTLKRSPQAPDLPTVAESAKSADLSNYDVSAWFGLFAPANTPRPIVERVNAAVNAMLKEPGFAKFIVENGGAPEGGTPEDLGRLVDTELTKWKAVIERAGVPKQ
ncbi:Bug family tripartite tricarboxylate transporter substrate binding protein [Methylobacterium sp. J-070]|uniref:Bug family tripartite tricarboxylate transporter substrate binding protein n=1 Tax=Methylobacterium sp. J-070 TaxID=2836650 RepID=UPI001FB888DD|nr:tripartite tricarboxylate transporter substrate binding protein [Methylobacterium sp. J-070]MCJ2050375.1 tripartite tricarboxylate transporter substrate binding protein [Methylobacterium sp. J-070]